MIVLGAIVVSDITCCGRELTACVATLTAVRFIETWLTFLDCLPSVGAFLYAEGFGGRSQLTGSRETSSSIQLLMQWFFSFWMNSTKCRILTGWWWQCWETWKRVTGSYICSIVRRVYRPVTSVFLSCVQSVYWSWHLFRQHCHDDAF